METDSENILLMEGDIIDMNKVIFGGGKRTQKNTNTHHYQVVY